MNNDHANWKVYFAQTVNATTQNPTIYQSVAGDRFIHGSNVSVLGLGGAANRNLADFFQVAIDPLGLALIAYASDANDFGGHTYVTHQVQGINLHTGKRVKIKGQNLDAPAPVDPEVRDFRWDARVETRPPVSPEVDLPSDIISIDYGCERGIGKALITATMKTSGLNTVPPSSFWRMSFASNPTKPGLSDRADQWFLRADTDTAGVRTFTYGTAVRGSTGGITYTTVGAADSGFFNLVNRSVTVKVDIAKLNALQTRGFLGPGTTFIGLRGTSIMVPQATFTIAGLVTLGASISDSTRGGSSFTLNSACFP